MRINLDEQTDIDVIKRVLALKGLTLADIGCGDGAFATLLAENGATVLGVEPDPIQAALNRTAEINPRVTLIEAGAEALPIKDATQDALIFRFSFHHIPEALHAKVFKEARRTLKPGGKLLVIEPVADGPSQHVMALFHDETEVRAQVQTALKTLAPKYFDHQQTYHYQTTRQFHDFSAYVARYTSHSYNHYHPDSVNNAAVKARFEAFSDKAGMTSLVQPIKADLFISKEA